MPADLAERLALVQAACARLHVDARIIDWSASLSQHRVHQVMVNSAGGLTDQQFRYIVPNASVTARDHDQTQTRTSAGQYNGLCRQGGLEVLEAAGFLDAATPLAEEAIALTGAPNCPEGRMDVLLMPDQMMLQIHESIGHPLELDRILGDERNFAGSSFVTLDMFGHYRYGSELLNVSFDPHDPAEFASFGFDDDGEPATKALLIERGLLLRPLGGSLSVARASRQQAALLPVATSRACSWNRAPIDRMSNLNIEPGSSSLADMIASIERGVMMKTNCSWSIDDVRNKFQFGCEFGQMIRDGRLAEIVRNPNYRGQSASFWRSLRAVGNRDTVEALGTPFCGKGEPMQVIRVGHASPACLFGDVAVFGGARAQPS
ncbi:MAG: TldD/PmbA family protein [Burkholderiaceae bacterium]